MIATGERAPAFELPAVVDGEIDRVALQDCLGAGVVVLAFYPSDFNPACTDGTTGLDDLDLFTIQRNVSVLAISTDSVHSHRAFAAEYDLGVPLLADVGGDVTRAYGLAVEDPDAGYLTRRALVVVGPDGEVTDTWLAGGPRDLPDVEDLQAAVGGIESADTAASRYRVAHAHYVEGRRAFTSAAAAAEDREWLMARGDFTRAREEFEEAVAQFETARRFADDGTAADYCERGEGKARELRQAAAWLADAASAHARGDGAEAEDLRQDAEAPLERAREVRDPPDPDRFQPGRDSPPPEPDAVSAGAESDAGATTVDSAELDEITAEVEAQSGPTGESDREDETPQRDASDGDVGDGDIGDSDAEDSDTERRDGDANAAPGSDRPGPDTE
jgi:peroxiredoxin